MRPIAWVCWLLLSTLAVPGGYAQLPQIETFCGYEIDAFLDVPGRLVDATEIVSFRNPGPGPLAEIRFHLYANAYASTETLHMQEGFLERGEKIFEETRDRDNYAAIDVQSVHVEETMTDLGPGTVIQGTGMVVPLPAPLGPGEEIRLKIQYVLRLPRRTIGRLGVRGSHFDVVQWYPRVAALVDGIWRDDPFHFHGEFFGDFATFEVKLRVPEDFVIGATGVQQGEPEDVGDGTVRLAFRADGVHDFAWSANPRFREVTKTVTLDGGHDVEVVYLQQPGLGASRANRVLEAAARGLRFYSERLFPYPYPKLTIVGLPPGASDGGMEYPMLFTIPVRWAQTRFDRRVESVVLHEFGHQYWQGMIATDEVNEPWLDEGITSYLTTKILEESLANKGGARLQTGAAWLGWIHHLNRGIGFALGPAGADVRIGPLTIVPLEFNLARVIGFRESPMGGTEDWSVQGYELDTAFLDLPGIRGGISHRHRAAYLDCHDTDPVTSPSQAFFPGHYYPLAYSRTAVVLETIERHIGRDAMFEALGDFALEYRFRHPTGDDFLRVLRESSPYNLDALIEQLVRGRGVVDFAVVKAETGPKAGPEGLSPQERPGDGRSRLDPDPGAPSAYLSRVLVQQLGTVSLPTEVLLRFEDGSQQTMAWDGSRSWQAYAIETASALVSAEVDPERKYFIDRNNLNNSRTAVPQIRPLVKVSGLVLFWIQNVLHAVSAVG